MSHGKQLKLHHVRNSSANRARRTRRSARPKIGFGMEDTAIRTWIAKEVWFWLISLNHNTYWTFYGEKSTKKLQGGPKKIGLEMENKIRQNWECFLRVNVRENRASLCTLGPSIFWAKSMIVEL
jgi:hypothetical protein